MNKMIDYSKGFNLGYMQLRQKDVKMATQELWEAIGIHNRNTFIAYRYGKREPKASQVQAINGVFEKYGIIDVWGEVEE